MHICMLGAGLIKAWLDVARARDLKVVLRPSGVQRQAWIGVSGIIVGVCEAGLFMGDGE